MENSQILKPPSDIDPKQFIEEGAKNAKARGDFCLVSPSWFTDEQWNEINKAVRHRGPLNTVQQKLEFEGLYANAQHNVMDLFFECERLYCIINWLMLERDSERIER